MPKLEMAVPHHLAQDEAVKRIKNLLNNLKTEHADRICDLQEEWDGHTGTFRFSAMGFPLSGTLTVNKSRIEISGHLPFAAMLFKGKIESAIKEGIETLLA